jgi:hypothetical protein
VPIINGHFYDMGEHDEELEYEPEADEPNEPPKTNEEYFNAHVP